MSEISDGLTRRPGYRLLSQEEWTKMMANHVTPPPLNECIIYEARRSDGVYTFMTKDDHGVMRIYEGEAPAEMPRAISA